MRKKIPLPTGEDIRRTLFSLGELGDPDYFATVCRKTLREWRRSPTFKPLLSSDFLRYLAEDLERNLAVLERCLRSQHPPRQKAKLPSVNRWLPDSRDAIGAGMTAAFEFMAITSVMEAPKGGMTPNKEMWGYVQAEEDKNPGRKRSPKVKAAIDHWIKDKLDSLRLCEGDKQRVNLKPPLTLKHMVRTYTGHVKLRRKPTSTLTDDPSQASRKTSV